MLSTNMLAGDPQVEPLIRIFELYLLQTATLDDMREPTTVATRAMLNTGMSPEMILTVLDGAVQVAAGGVFTPDTGDKATLLADQMGPWLLAECFDANIGNAAIAPRD
ncbi:MAG: hypothetical protein M3Z30_06110 [Gemmatimonadota bacterium]|nr:hypothetical protein [Gemmatimonadota bacterium]